MSDFTDDDVTAAEDAILFLPGDWEPRAAAIAVLTAVASAIAARVERRVRANTLDWACDNLPPTFPRVWLREQADATRAEQVAAMSDYRCKWCGKTVQRDSDKAWVKSWCSTTEKTVHLVRVSGDE